MASCFHRLIRRRSSGAWQGGSDGFAYRTSCPSCRDPSPPPRHTSRCEPQGLCSKASGRPLSVSRTFPVRKLLARGYLWLLSSRRPGSAVRVVGTPPCCGQSKLADMPAWAVMRNGAPREPIPQHPVCVFPSLVAHPAGRSRDKPAEQYLAMKYCKPRRLDVVRHGGFTCPPGAEFRPA